MGKVEAYIASLRILGAAASLSQSSLAGCMTAHEGLVKHI